MNTESRLFYTFSTRSPSVTFWIPVKNKYVCMSMPVDGEDVGVYDEIRFGRGPRVISELDFETCHEMASRLHYITHALEPFVSGKAQDCGKCFEKEQRNVIRSGLAPEIKITDAYSVVAAEDCMAITYIQHASSQLPAVRPEDNEMRGERNQ